MLQVSPDQVEKNLAELDNTPNYTIEVNDILTVDVFTNNGERIIDPDFELSKDLGVNQANIKPNLEYLVNSDGTVKLPMIGMIALQGETLREAEQLLQEKYSEYYKSPFVVLNYKNKRVTVIGTVNQIVELKNENTRLIEVLAAADAIDNDAIVQNVRLVRGNNTYLLDLSTSKGIEQTNVIVQPGDIVYVEPLRRPFIEAVKDYGPIISLVSSITAIVVIISTTGK